MLLYFRIIEDPHRKNIIDITLKKVLWYLFIVRLYFAGETVPHMTAHHWYILKRTKQKKNQLVTNPATISGVFETFCDFDFLDVSFLPS